MWISCSYGNQRRTCRFVISSPCRKKKDLCFSLAQVEAIEMTRLFKSQHIRTRSDFERFRKKCAYCVSCDFFLLKKIERPVLNSLCGDCLPRIGIIVSKKIGCSVTRNRVRRVIREYFRTHQDLFHQYCDYLVITRSGVGEQTGRLVCAELEHCIK